MIRVLDLSCDLAGKYAARLLADHGGDVISIALSGNSPILAKAKARGVKSADLEVLRDHLGRNKRHVTLDYGNPSGNKSFERLVGEADVVIHTFTPEISELLGLDAAALRAVNPSLLVVSITAHGHLSEDAEKPATRQDALCRGRRAPGFRHGRNAPSLDSEPAHRLVDRRALWRDGRSHAEPGAPPAEEPVVRAHRHRLARSVADQPGARAFVLTPI